MKTDNSDALETIGNNTEAPAEKKELLNDKYIIVAGANGYLGSYVCRELLKQNYKVIGFKYPHFASVIIKNENIEYIHCDIRKNIIKQEGIFEIVNDKNILGIINTAALLGSSDYDSNYAVNVEGVKNIMDFAKEIDVRRIIHISSVVVLKDIKGPYRQTKLEGHKILEKSSYDYTVFIPAMILGPESLGLNRILKNVFRIPLFVPLIGNGKQTQHPIYVKDFAHCIVASIEAEQTYQKTYEIAGDTVISFKDLVTLILKLKNRKTIFIPIPPSFAKLLGRLFQKTMKVPLFTAEHVKGILLDSHLSTNPIKKDLGFEAHELTEALNQSLKIVGDDWDYYLNPREERTIEV